MSAPGITVSTRPVCTVIVTVDAIDGAIDNVMGDLVEHARAGIEEHFPRFAGYLGGALHVSADGTRLVQYLQWRSADDYVACRDDSSWHAIETTERFAAHARAGHARVDARVFTVVAVGSTAPG